MGARLGLDRRIERDLQRGDLGTARRRLVSTIRGWGGYAPERLARIAELSLRMGDPVVAGQYAFLSDRTSAELEKAIEAFVDACHRNPKTISEQLPRARRPDEGFPPVVERRLRDLAVEPRPAPVSQPAAPVPNSWSGGAIFAGCLVLLSAFVALAFYGLYHLLR